MTAYFWRPEDMTDPLVLPGALADAGLLLADAEQLRVLIWLSRNRLQWDAAACADALRMEPAACESALQFWVQQGTLVPGNAAPAGVAAPVARPAAVKPLLSEVLHYQQAHPEFSVFLEAASARLGKPLSHGDTATLLYLQDSVGLPMDVILMEIAYAVSIGKPNIRYVEKVALDWADKELTDFASVDAHIRHVEACRKAAARVEALLRLPRPLTAAQGETAYKWLEQWRVSEDLLRKAAEITAEKTGKFSHTYMDKILENWRAQGIQQPDQIPAAAPVRKKGPAATNPEETSLELDDLEQELLRYTPVFKKKA